MRYIVEGGRMTGYWVLDDEGVSERDAPRYMRWFHQRTAAEAHAALKNSEPAQNNIAQERDFPINCPLLEPKRITFAGLPWKNKG